MPDEQTTDDYDKVMRVCEASREYSLIMRNPLSDENARSQAWARYRSVIQTPDNAWQDTGNETERRRVPGGWLYKATKNGVGGGVALAFVPDQEAPDFAPHERMGTANV